MLCSFLMIAFNFDEKRKSINKERFNKNIYKNVKFYKLDILQQKLIEIIMYHTCIIFTLYLLIERVFHKYLLFQSIKLIMSTLNVK